MASYTKRTTKTAIILPFSPAAGTGKRPVTRMAGVKVKMMGSTYTVAGGEKDTKH